MTLWVCIALLAVGFLAIFIELFVPAGGMIGLGGFICMVAAVVFGYKDHGPLAGTLMLLVTVIGTPAAVVTGLRIFPRTYVGKKLILKEAQHQETGYTSYTSEKYADLLGAQGITVTTLRPAGMARINDRKYSVVTDGELIQAGTKIKVIAVEGSRIVVRGTEPPQHETA